MATSIIPQGGRIRTSFWDALPEILLAITSDPRLGGKHAAKTVATFLAASVNDRGRCRLSDDEIAEGTGTSVATVPDILALLAYLGYLEETRKRLGWRDITFQDHLFSEAKETRQNSVRRPSKNAVGERDSSSTHKETKKTPNARPRSAADRESLKNATEDVDAAEQDGPTPDEITPDSLCDLSGLNNAFGYKHFAAAALKAASLFGDDIGAVYYDNCLRLVAQGDLDLFAEGVRRVFVRHQANRLHSEAREYLRRVLVELASQKNQDYAHRQRQGERDQQAQETETRAREAVEKAVIVPTPQATVADPDLDELIAVDPFADDKSRPEQARPAHEFIAHPAVLKAKQGLELTVSLEDLQALFTGVCRGREAVWTLCMSSLTKGYHSAKALISKIALEHQDKDDAYCLDRAKGIKVAERTQILNDFERMLEEKKQELNPAISFLREFRSDSLSDMKSLVGGIMDHVAKTVKPAENLPPFLAAVTLPTTSQGRSVLEEAMGAVRDEYQHADLLVKDQARAAGVALANAKCFQAQAEAAEGGKMKSQADLDRDRESWRRVGVYHAYLALRQPSIRAENVGCAQTVDQVTDSLGEEPHPRSVFIDPDEEEYTYVP